MSKRAFDLTPFQLAYRAECGTPDSIVEREGEQDSAGADFLDSIARCAAELIEESPGADYETIDYNGSAHEQIDGAVPIYTHTVWSAFVELAAYQEDISDYGDPEADMTKNAQVALYIIGERLMRALLEEFGGEVEEDAEVES